MTKCKLIYSTAVMFVFCFTAAVYALPNNNNMVTDKFDPINIGGESRIACTMGFCGITVEGYGWSNAGSWQCSSDNLPFTETRSCWRSKSGESFTVSFTPDKKARGTCSANEPVGAAPDGAQVGSSTRKCVRDSVFVNNNSKNATGGIFFVGAPSIRCDDWSACNSTPFDPAPAVCTPGDRQYQPCGECGTQYKECSRDGKSWGMWSACPDFKAQIGEVTTPGIAFK